MRLTLTRTTGLLAGLCAVALLMAGATMIHGAAAVPTPGASVHVCSLGNYDAASVACTRDDQTLRDLDAARLQFESAGDTFSKDSVLINVAAVNANGSDNPLGSTTNEGLLGYGTSSSLLSATLAMAGVIPSPGTTYRLTVGYSDEANGMAQLLGSTTFTYQE